MSRAGRAQIRGRALAMAPPNGMPSGGGYRRFGVQDWDPAKGRHLDEAAVRPVRTADRYEARLSSYAELAATGMSQHEIALRLGVSDSTVSDYARVLRRRATEAAAQAGAGGAS